MFVIVDPTTVLMVDCSTDQKEYNVQNDSLIAHELVPSLNRF